MIKYTKQVGNNELNFEALVEAIGCRQTNAEWSYRYLYHRSTVGSLDVAKDLDGRTRSQFSPSRWNSIAIENRHP
jgi:hypothetical protein